MKKYTYNRLSKKEINKICERGGIDMDKIRPIVRGIKDDVYTRGDEAIRELTQKFDGVALEKFAVTEAELEASVAKVDKEFMDAIEVAIDNIRKFHRSQVINPMKVEKIETSPGVACWRESRAIERVGLYIPGGTAPLFSTILMTVVPAQIAGCEKIVLCTPPNPAPEILYTAKFLGIPAADIFQIGGAQAIFAMSGGTEQVPKVDKIFGPGNAFVMAAKIMASEVVAIDMPAGPSEVLVVADENANASFVAADILSQAEHGADSQSVLVVNSESKCDEILEAVQVQLEKLPRKEMTQKSLDHSYAVIVENWEDGMDFSNAYAPEHLILNLKESILGPIQKAIKNAGSVFVGANACESFGDYASGTNHVLPTSGFARNFSGVSVDSFVKKITFQSLTDQGVKELGPAVEVLADREELFAHKNAITVRLEAINSKQ